MKLCKQLPTKMLIFAWAAVVVIPLLDVVYLVAHRPPNWVIVVNSIWWCCWVNSLVDHYARVRFDRMVERVDQERAR